MTKNATLFGREDKISSLFPPGKGDASLIGNMKQILLDQVGTKLPHELPIFLSKFARSTFHQVLEIDKEFDVIITKSRHCSDTH